MGTHRFDQLIEYCYTAKNSRSRTTGNKIACADMQLVGLPSFGSLSATAVSYAEEPRNPTMQRPSMSVGGLLDRDLESLVPLCCSGSGAPVESGRLSEEKIIQIVNKPAPQGDSMFSLIKSNLSPCSDQRRREAAAHRIRCRTSMMPCRHVGHCL